MKYMQNGGFQNHPLMKLTIGLTLVFMAGLCATSIMMYFARMSLDPASVATYYLGSEADFVPARSYASMLEVTHMHLPMIAMVMLLLTHLVIFAEFSFELKVGLIVVSFLSSLLNEASGWLVRFVHPGFAWLKVASFVVSQASVAFLIGALTWFLWVSPLREERRARRAQRNPH